MVVVERIHLKVGDQNPYFQVNQHLNHDSVIVDYQMEDHKLFIDIVKADENDEPIMIQDPEEGEIPLIETVPFDKEVKGLLRMDFVLDVSDGTVSSAVLLLPEGVDEVRGYNISASIMTNNAGRDL